MKKNALLPFVGMTLMLCLLAMPARADEGSQRRTIRVAASATSRGTPDRVALSVSVVARGHGAKEAAEAGAKAGKAVLDRLRELVPSPGEVKTVGYDLAAEYDYNRPAGEGRPRLLGYVATHRFRVVSAKPEGAGELVDAVVAAGAAQVDSVTFFVADEDALRGAALEEAGRKARAQAEAIARGLGVGLGEVLEASSAGDSGPGPVPMREGMAMMASAPRAATEVAPGQVEVGASVSVSFAVR